MKKKFEDQYRTFIITISIVWVLGVYFIVTSEGNYLIVGHILIWGSIFGANLASLIYKGIKYLKEEK